ncbi:MAG: cysteine hydrolase family protein [Rhodovibrionaceae bacterium]
MSHPKTLLQMAGAPATPKPLSESVVVMIDAQEEYLRGVLKLPAAEAALQQGAALLARARAAGRPIVHVQHRGKSGGGVFDPENGTFEIAAAVAPEAGELRIEKGLPNAFAGTDLDAKLKELGAKTLIVAGFMTHMCVSSTVRAALDLGYGCSVVGSACATRDLPDGQGGVVSHTELHRAELAALSDRFAIVAPSVSDILE